MNNIYFSKQESSAGDKIAWMIYNISPEIL